MIRKTIDEISRFVAAAFGFSIPVSTALNSILMALIVPLWLFGRDFKNKLSVVRDNKYIWSIFILIGLYFVGLFYGAANMKQAADEFLATASLLLIPMMIPFFKDEKVRNNALNLFLLTMTIMLFISYLMWFGWLPENYYFKGSQKNPVLFLASTKHSLLMAFSAFIFAVHARQSANWKIRLLFIVLTILFVFNITVMVGGKTGYLILIVLTAYYFIEWLRWKGFLAAVLAIAVFGIFTYSNTSSTMHKRSKEFFVDISETNILDLRSQEFKKSSTGKRIMFYKNTLKIILDHPLLGVGTGGFTEAYSQIVKDTKMPIADNPHTHYLRVTAELGLLGLCAFLFMFFMQWRLASSLHTKSDEIIARGFVLTYLSASMVASALNSHLTRTFYIWMSALLFGGYMSYRHQNDDNEISDKNSEK